MATSTNETADILLDDTDLTPDGAADYADPRGQKRASRSKGARSASSVSAPRVTGAKELASVLAKVIGGASVVLALFLVGPDDAGDVAMTTSEANAIAQPAARMLAKSRLAKRAAALAARGGDAVDLALALATYALRIYPLIVTRQAQAAALAQRGSSPYATAGQATGVRPADTAATAHAEPTGPADFSAVLGAAFADPDALKAGTYRDVGTSFRNATSS